jgi:hypothetical protein
MTRMWKLMIALLIVSPVARAEENIRHELSPQVAFYTGDALRTTTLGGLQYAFHFNRTFWFGLDGLLGKTSMDRGNGTLVDDGDRLIGVDGAFYINIPATLAGTSADLYTSIGMGNLWLGSEKELYGFLGGGMVLQLPPKWLAIRFDLRGIFFQLDNSAGSDFNSDLVLSIGPSLVL